MDRNSIYLEKVCGHVWCKKVCGAGMLYAKCVGSFVVRKVCGIRLV
jgi:hypothetical protein